VNGKAVGLVGLGLVGRALAARLSLAGRPVLGYDRDAQAMQAYTASGGVCAESLAAMGREVNEVVLAVYDTAGVIEVLEGAAGLLQPGHRVSLVVDCSTGSPKELTSLHARLQARNVDFVEAPLSGSSEQIAAGEAAALVGATGDAWTRAQPLLSALATRCLHAGPPGMGVRAKLATNLVLGLNRAVFAEGLSFAQALGIEPARFLEMVLATPAASEAARVKGPLMVERDFRPRSRIRQHLKDVDLMLAAAADQGLALPLSKVHAELLREAVADGDGDLDNAAIVRRWRASMTPK
jgi:3-hydroxyisobutyrate dehydrogenase-like beta-hydroxyacid dehydrogenase